MPHPYDGRSGRRRGSGPIRARLRCSVERAGVDLHRGRGSAGAPSTAHGTPARRATVRSVSRSRLGLFLGALSASALLAGAVVPAAAGAGAAVAGRPGAGAHRAAPVAASPWPEMRHDQRNTGLSPIVARFHGDRPWAFRTGRGIFSTPVIGGDGTVFIGSGDTWFYAIRPNGTLRWKLKTGGIIDAAAALSAYDPQIGSAPLTFGSGDARLYHVTTPRSGTPRILWRFRPTVAPGQRPTGQLVGG